MVGPQSCLPTQMMTVRQKLLGDLSCCESLFQTVATQTQLARGMAVQQLCERAWKPPWISLNLPVGPLNDFVRNVLPLLKILHKEVTESWNCHLPDDVSSLCLIGYVKRFNLKVRDFWAAFDFEPFRLEPDGTGWDKRSMASWGTVNTCLSFPGSRTSSLPLMWPLCTLSSSGRRPV